MRRQARTHLRVRGRDVVEGTEGGTHLDRRKEKGGRTVKNNAMKSQRRYLPCLGM